MLEPETPSTTTIDEAHLNNFLIERGCSPKLKEGLQISPALKGSGYSDTSIRHNEVLLEQQTKPHPENDS